MSFLHTLATLAQHAVQTAEAPLHNAAQAAHYGGGGVAQAVQAAPLSHMQYSGAPETQDQARAAINPGGVTNYLGNHGFTPNMAGTSSLLQQLAIRQQQSPYNLGNPGSLGAAPDMGGDYPIQGNSMGLQQGQSFVPVNGGIAPDIQRTGFGFQQYGHQNPQVHDNGYYWYQ